MSKQILNTLPFALFFLMVMTACVPLYAQRPPGLKNDQLAIYHARNLRQGTLIIRLHSQRSKLEKLKALSEKQGPDQAYWMQQYENTLSELEKNYSVISEAFSREYRHSKICYIFDYQMPELLRGESISARIRPDSSATIMLNPTSDTWYLFTDYIESVEMGHYYILDKSFKPIPAPFPGKMRKNSVWNVFLSIFDKKQSPQRDHMRMIQKFNAKLNRLDPYFGNF
jgi:hypothetical protein